MNASVLRELLELARRHLAAGQEGASYTAYEEGRIREKRWWIAQLEPLLSHPPARAPAAGETPRPYTYTTNQPDNIGAWRLGEAVSKVRPGGDFIDGGLSLLQQLEVLGYGVVKLPNPRTQT